VSSRPVSVLLNSSRVAEFLLSIMRRSCDVPRNPISKRVSARQRGGQIYLGAITPLSAEHAE
jgi:hypothetical protein